MKLRQILVRAGITSKDINNGGGINPFINMDYSLLFKKNYLKLYESRYLTIGYSTEIVNGLTLNLSGNFEDRRVLQNTTNFSLFKSSKAYSDNTPVNTYLSAGSNPINELSDQRHFDIVTKLTYTPFQKYRISGGTKVPAGSDWPTFDLTWQHGINEFKEMSSKIKTVRYAQV